MQMSDDEGTEENCYMSADGSESESTSKSISPRSCTSPPLNSMYDSPRPSPATSRSNSIDRSRSRSLSRDEPRERSASRSRNYEYIIMSM